MTTQELIKKVRKIEIKTKRLSQDIFGGEYHSAFKGRGMTFSEVRGYNYGDDVRNIDWNVTARYNEPYIKTFEEERELTLMLAVDISGSSSFGSSDTTKREYMTEIAATLAFSALQNNDKVGLLLFTDRVELFIPPKKGKAHVLRLIRELLQHEPVGTGTDLDPAMTFIAGYLKKRSICFFLSDFMDDDYNRSLRILARKHDLTGMRITDPRDEELPNMGLVQLRDLETGARKLIATGSRSAQRDHRSKREAARQYFEDSFKKAGSGSIETSIEDDYVRKLMAYFKQR